jgi:hypothetical protein
MNGILLSVWIRDDQCVQVVQVEILKLRALAAVLGRIRLPELLMEHLLLLQMEFLEIRLKLVLQQH